MIRLLEVDPELGLRVPAGEIARARRTLVAPLRRFEPGLHEVPHDEGPHGYLGYLIVDGLVARDLILAGHVSTELLGDGDFLQPWLAARAEGLLRTEVLWQVLSPSRVAVLGEPLGSALAEWPQVTAALLERTIRRTHRMAVHQALLQLTPVSKRLLLLMWHLAERWGHVTSAGIVLRLGLTHQLLGQLVGSQRASVTTALKELAADGSIARRPDGMYLLRGSAPDELGRAEGHFGAPRHASAALRSPGYGP